MKNKFYASSQAKFWDTLLIIVLSLIFILVAVSIYKFDSTSPSALRILSVMLLPITFGAIIAIVGSLYKEYVEITEEGVRYYSGLFIFETQWNKVEIKRFIWREGILMNLPKGGFINIIFSIIFIPFSRFSENWRDSELGQQIKQYAPHLFK